VGQVFAQVEAYVTDDCINLGNVLTLIVILQMVFRDPEHVVIAEYKLEALKQSNYNYST
jgi:hypothetical protein